MLNKALRGPSQVGRQNQAGCIQRVIYGKFLIEEKIFAISPRNGSTPRELVFSRLNKGVRGGSIDGIAVNVDGGYSRRHICHDH